MCVYVCVCVCPSHPKNSEAIFCNGERAKHAVSFQIIKYIIQKNITTSWAPKYSVVRFECLRIRYVCNNNKQKLFRNLPSRFSFQRNNRRPQNRNGSTTRVFFSLFGYMATWESVLREILPNSPHIFAIYTWQFHIWVYGHISLIVLICQFLFWFSI